MGGVKREGRKRMKTWLIILICDRIFKIMKIPLAAFFIQKKIRAFD